jgi:hypothetical protein
MTADPPSAAMPALPRTATRARPASYPAALLLVLAVVVGAEVIAHSVAQALADAPPGILTLVLLGVGGAAFLALVVLNARWLWATLGNLKFALALITVWAVASVLGTLVVQRFPNQTDTGYAKNFTSATGDFLYNATHAFAGVEVHAAPEVEGWLATQARLYGSEQGEQIRLDWFKAETARLRQLEIERYTAEHAGLLQDILRVVSALRLPEAFQISVWFKALLGLLSVALVVVVIQRWRGEWRQVGWAMAHFGMVLFVAGASLRATLKVDGFLPMRVGETSDHYYRNVTEAREPTPLDFEFTLHRFKTEYPKQLLVSLTPAGEAGGTRPFRVDAGWTHPFLEDTLTVTVERELSQQRARTIHVDVPGGDPDPAALVELRTAWLPVPLEAALRSGTSAVIPPDDGYHLQYERARDADDAVRLRNAPPGSRPAGTLFSEAGPLPGEIAPGVRWPLPGSPGTELRAVALYPDYERREEPEALTRPAHDPALHAEVLRAGALVAEVWIFAGRMVASPDAGVPELRLLFDWFEAAAPFHYRLVDAPGEPLTVTTWRGGEFEATVPLAPGEPFLLGEDGDALTLRSVCERCVALPLIEPADTGGLSPEDVYYASLPSALELRIEGEAVARLAAGMDTLRERFPELGFVAPEAWARGQGRATTTPDGAGLRVRLLSDDPELGTFPHPFFTDLMRSAGALLVPVELRWFTNERGSPLRFTSDVTLSRHGVPLVRALVEPNRPLYLAGYQFSQADFRADDPGYSGFGVVRDPSVRVVYYGMGVLVLGVILLFYVNPMIAARKGRRSTP